MGIYLNPPADGFEDILKDDIYVDKTELIADGDKDPVYMARQHHDYQREGSTVGYYYPGGEPKTDASKADSKSDASSSKADTSKKDVSSSKADAGKTSAAAATSSKASDDTSKAAETGAAVGGALAVIALAGTAVIVAKRRK